MMPLAARTAFAGLAAPEVIEMSAFCRFVVVLTTVLVTAPLSLCGVVYKVPNAEFPTIQSAYRATSSHTLASRSPYAVLASNRSTSRS